MTPIYRKIALRVIPFLFICYLFNYIDRVNVGFAKLQMLEELGMSEAVYGLGAGIFFIGYLVCGIPSNLMLQKVGARRWIALMMVSWGLFSTALMFVRTPAGFYMLRLLTGAAEAGFFPGIVLYLTRWFPQARHGRVMTLFMSAIPISGVLGGPVSGWILGHFSAGQHGLSAWQWLFLLQGLPTVVLGMLVWFVLDDGAEQADWLSPGEKRALRDDLARDEAARPEGAAITFGGMIRNPVIWLLGALYFFIQSGVYGINFWLPTIIANSGHADPVAIGLLSAIPYLAAVIFMVAMGHSADRRRERRWHLVVPLALSLAGLLIAAAAQDPGVSLAGMTLATAGALTGLPLFWPLANSQLSAATAAAGFALINSCGQIAGFVSPYLIGLIKDSTGNTATALIALAAGMSIGALIVVCVPAHKTLR
ncbi:MFS transporter [Sphingomonas quercus]|uniref:MFS transporter n=1 Tax=Sphingomonas quercus TaxID=2842451 RepID=A0ABS6BGF9_9SPHN|nr:MFS transporter [Sphingomonas quercus]MBU3077387.1 MFS transporter [Sphingomonas quercus]